MHRLRVSWVNEYVSTATSIKPLLQHPAETHLFLEGLRLASLVINDLWYTQFSPTSWNNCQSKPKRRMFNL